MRSRGRLLAVSVAAAIALIAPSTAAAADTTPPSAPPEAYYHWDFQCTGVHFAWWRSSTDNVDSTGDLRYRFYDADGRLLSGGGQSSFASNPGSDGGTWTGFTTAPRTVRAVDRAGNLSRPTTLVHGLPGT